MNDAMQNSSFHLQIITPPQSIQISFSMLEYVNNSCHLVLALLKFMPSMVCMCKEYEGKEKPRGPKKENSGLSLSELSTSMKFSARHQWQRSWRRRAQHGRRGEEHICFCTPERRKDSMHHTTIMRMSAGSERVAQKSTVNTQDNQLIPRGLEECI